MKDCGGMAERLKAAVLKTAEARASVGSNPTPSARLGGDTPQRWGGTLLNVQLEIGMSPLGVSPFGPLGNVPDGPERWPSRLKATAC